MPRKSPPRRGGIFTNGNVTSPFQAEPAQIGLSVFSKVLSSSRSATRATKETRNFYAAHCRKHPKLSSWKRLTMTAEPLAASSKQRREAQNSTSGLKLHCTSWRNEGRSLTIQSSALHSSAIVFSSTGSRETTGEEPQPSKLGVNLQGCCSGLLVLRQRWLLVARHNSESDEFTPLRFKLRLVFEMFAVYIASLQEDRTNPKVF